MFATGQFRAFPSKLSLFGRNRKIISRLVHVFNCYAFCNNMIVKVNILGKLAYHYHHSHKKRKGSLETRSLCIEIYLVSWNSPYGPKYRGSILRNMASSDGDQPLARAFDAIMDKIEADIWKEMNLYASGILFQKDSSYKCLFCMKDAHL